MARDHYKLHRAALVPVLPRATQQDFDRAIAQASATGEMEFAQFLCGQGLAPLWDERLEHQEEPIPLLHQFLELIHKNRLHATAAYLIQRHSLGLARAILDDACVSHVITKGCHTREVYYATPALRPAQDIDILVHPHDKIRAIKAFQQKGFEFHGVIENIAQDCSLLKGKTSIDLHWDILRPGRTRQPMVKELLDSRVDYGGHWGMSHGATLFLMLVHPVFRKYSTTPYASLVRLVDLAKLLQQHPEATNEARELLQTAGMTTAGWITATWLYMLTQNPRAKSLADTLRPGKLKQKYLHSWLATNRSTRLLDHATLIQLGFTLPAHDRLADSVRALRQARRCKQEAGATLSEMQQQLAFHPETDA